MAPFWKLAPSAGESTRNVGARTAEIGTFTMYASVCSEFLPVSGSVAEILKSLRHGLRCGEKHLAGRD